MEQLNVSFVDLDNNVFSISYDDLNVFPHSFLTTLVTTRVGCARIDVSKPIKVAWFAPTLEMTAEYYAHHVWRNPYNIRNRLRIDGVDGSFDDLCDYLGLPNHYDGETDDEEDEEVYVDDNYPGCEDDVSVYYDDDYDYEPNDRDSGGYYDDEIDDANGLIVYW